MKKNGVTVSKVVFTIFASIRYFKLNFKDQNDKMNNLLVSQTIFNIMFHKLSTKKSNLSVKISII